LRCQTRGLHKPGANTKTAVFKFKFCVEPVRERPHELKAQPAIGRGIEILGKADAVIRYFDQERAVVLGLAMDLHDHRQAGGVSIFDCVGKKLGGDKPGVKRMTRLDIAFAGTFDGQVHLSVRAERANHLGDVPQEIPEIDAIAVDGERQRFVEFRGHLDARADIVEQMAHLVRGQGLAASRNGVALQANGAAQAPEVVCYPMIGFGQPDISTLDQNCHVFIPVKQDCALQRAGKQENNNKINALLTYWTPLSSYWPNAEKPDNEYK